MHKDLSDEARGAIEYMAALAAATMDKTGQGLALAREAWLAAFDAAAEQLDCGE